MYIQLNFVKKVYFMKHLTILHSNDIHGQLAFKIDKDFVMRGGISMMANYIRNVRFENPNTFYGICGDVLQEDITGSDYKGVNTVTLLNTLKPDAFSLGNHELDYGLSHLLVFNQCLNTEVINANIYVDHLNCPLFKPSMIYECGDIKILLIGLIPESFFKKINSNEFCRSMLSYKDSYEAIREEIHRHKKDTPDLTIVMSHYGIEGDRLLAENMPDDCKVDLILGGHTHINMDEAEVINNIPIAQSSYGTTHIGRFEIDVNDLGGIDSWTWERVEINDTTCEFDYELDKFTDSVAFSHKKAVSKKKLGLMADIYRHESRLHETDLGDIISDAFLESYDVDLVILQSGSIRAPECPVELQESDLKNIYPFDDEFVSVSLTGKQIKDMFEYLFSLKDDGSVMPSTFQYSRGFKLVVDGDDCFNKGCKILELTLEGKELDDEAIYTVGLTGNCLANLPRYFNTYVEKSDSKLLSLSTYYDLAKWFLSQKEPVCVKGKGRFSILNFEG